MRQEGYTLAELLVVTAILGMVVAATLGVYQVSQQSYILAASLEDAQLGARAGLDRMATDLRLIGAFGVLVDGAPPPVTVATRTRITFRGDIDADTVTGTHAETTGAAAAGGADTASVDVPAGVTAAEAFKPGELLYIAGTDGVTREARAISAVAATAISLDTPLTSGFPEGSLVRSVETVTYDVSGSRLRRTVGAGGADTIVDNVTDLALTYFEEGSPPAEILDTSAQTDRDRIREIRISLTTTGRGGTRRTLTSRIRPPNLSLR
jgi:prepilin-type N-terminal cleavage/methylation domain-containing protein